MRPRTPTCSTLVPWLLALAPTAARAGDCGVPAPDLRIGDLPSVTNYATGGGVDALSLGIVACNVGAQPISVQPASSQHYVVTSNLYRWKDMGGWSAFEQVGLSWVFHSFCALAQSTCCACTPAGGCSVLSPGCSSPDSSSVAGQSLALGPRADVSAASASFPHPYSNPPVTSANHRRLAVLPSDLEPTGSGTRYFAELLALAQEDAAAGRSDDNASWRELHVVASGGEASFSVTGSTEVGVPALYAWQGADPAVEVREIALAGDGRLLLAWRVTDLGGGTWHYEYALANLDSTEGVGAFALPLSAGVSVTSPGFHDVTYRGGDGLDGVDRDGTDWTHARLAGTLEWRTASAVQDPNANALRWGTLYNFRFDASTPPTSGTVVLTRFESGATESVPGVAVPSAADAGLAFCDGSDAAHQVCPCANPGLPDAGCDNAQATGGVALSVPLFAPDGSGGGRAGFLAQGFPPSATPGAVLMRSVARDLTPPVFGDGVLCLELAGLVRVGSASAAGGSLALSLAHGAGAGTFCYQLWYRNLPASYCTPAGFNLSSARQLVW